MADASQNPLGLSDEDFLKQPHPPEADGVSSDGNNSDGTTESANQQQETQDNQNGGNTDEGTDGGSTAASDSSDSAQGAEDQTGKTDGTGDGADATADTGASDTNNKTGEDGKTAENTSGSDSSSGSGEADPAKQEKQGSEQAPDYAALYGKIMAPFQANGKKIELKSPEEAIQLMQMGANYTRKLQELAPHRKIITMLGNHGLLDESKLSFFISLDKKDPEAIKKLIVDSGIDPLDIDTKIEPAYREGSYQVTDEEVAFRTQLEDLTSTDMGKQTLQIINSDWDQASKDMLWQHPEVMPIIHEQRENGIYAKITQEMDRRRTLGQLLPTTPFLEAYKTVGDELHASGAFVTPEQSEQGAGQTRSNGDQNGTGAEKPTPKVVATDRAAAPRPSVDNGDKAGAASPSRAAPGKATEVKNFLAMSDDDFLKASGLEGRV